MKAGYIYIFSNTKQKDIVKVGESKNNPIIRAEQLTRQTGSVGTWEVEWYLEVPDCEVAETMAHHLLQEWHEEKEYFKIGVLSAVELIQPKLVSFFDILKPVVFEGDMLQLRIKAKKTKDMLMKLEW
jgi:hypothetical protein